MYAPRRNWDSPNPFLASECSPPPRNRGEGGTLACGWGVGGSPNSNEGHTLWYSFYVRTLCFFRSKNKYKLHMDSCTVQTLGSVPVSVWTVGHSSHFGNTFSSQWAFSTLLNIAKVLQPLDNDTMKTFPTVPLILFQTREDIKQSEQRGLKKEQDVVLRAEPGQPPHPLHRRHQETVLQGQ